MASAFEHAKVQEGFRAKCEDRVQVYHLGNHLIAVVSDGVGGLTGGENASSMVLSELEKFAPSAKAPMDASAWVSFVEDLDHRMREKEGVGQATLIIAVASPDKITGVAVGDSDCYLVGPDSAVQLTADAEREQFVGCGFARPVPFEADFNGTLVLGSDGVFKFASLEQIVGVVREEPPALAVKKLFQTVLSNTNGVLRDDFAAAVVRPKVGGPGSDDELKTPIPMSDPDATRL